jgi:hypothetical protein
VISCRNSGQGKEERLITFDLKELPPQGPLNLSDLGAVDIQYIPLETTGQGVIPGIRKIIVSKDYFLTVYFSNIFMFRHDGSFVTKIGKVGKGPDEFTVAHDVDIDKNDGSIYLAAGFQQKFFVFSPEGNLVRTFKTPLSSAMSFRLTGEGILCYYSNHMGEIENSYFLVDTTGTILRNFPNKYPWTRTVPNVFYQGENLFYNYDNQLLKKEIYCDTVYSWKNGDFEPHMVIDVGSLRLAPDVRTNSSADVIMKNYITPLNLFEFGDYVYYEFIIPRNDETGQLAFIGSKNGDLSALIDPGKELLNDLDGGPSISPECIWDDNTIVSWVEALTLKNWVNSDTFKSSNPRNTGKKAELVRLADSLEETDNPVLVLVRFEE